MRRVDVLTARLRTLSTARRSKYGDLPADHGVWWQQMQIVAQEQDLPLAWEEYLEIVEDQQQRRSK